MSVKAYPIINGKQSKVPSFRLGTCDPLERLLDNDTLNDCGSGWLNVYDDDLPKIKKARDVYAEKKEPTEDDKEILLQLNNVIKDFKKRGGPENSELACDKGIEYTCY